MVTRIEFLADLHEGENLTYICQYLDGLILMGELKPQKYAKQLSKNTLEYELVHEITCQSICGLSTPTFHTNLLI